LFSLPIRQTFLSYLVRLEDCRNLLQDTTSNNWLKDYFIFIILVLLIGTSNPRIFLLTRKMTLI